MKDITKEFHGGRVEWIILMLESGDKGVKYSREFERCREYATFKWGAFWTRNVTFPFEEVGFIDWP